MEISEVRVKLVDKTSERLRAFCSITLDGAFVIRDLKIIGGTGGVFVAMPSRKLADRCPRCGAKNHLRAKYCNECGQKLNENRAPKDVQGRAKLHADVAHPINAECRECIQKAVMDAYEAEVERSKSPDYKPPRFDDFDDFAEEEESAEEVKEVVNGPRKRKDKTEAVEDVETDESFSDYNSLIAELKREAADRQERRRDRRNTTFNKAQETEPQEDKKRDRGFKGQRRGERPDRCERVLSKVAESDSAEHGNGLDENGSRGEPTEKDHAEEEVEMHASTPEPNTSRETDDFGAGL